VLTLYSRLLLAVEMIVTHPDVLVKSHHHFIRLDTAYGIRRRWHGYYSIGRHGLMTDTLLYIEVYMIDCKSTRSLFFGFQKFHHGYF
jgi:hypothetical protein